MYLFFLNKINLNNIMCNIMYNNINFKVNKEINLSFLI